ncbi:phosphoinositide 3-kinase adapter protein 1 isoform X3 [Bacillus rossius redtenbacheri]|uniref:phosphoinositide 3-kinase adapter protein 1 isoform X3 n=2 Tax=Bacillus rossius redtenbacheri TaxID=93214 RepID=UPI002FDCDAA5
MLIVFFFFFTLNKQEKRVHAARGNSREPRAMTSPTTPTTPSELRPFFPSFPAPPPTRGGDGHSADVFVGRRRMSAGDTLAAVGGGEEAEGTRAADMADILIVSSQDSQTAALWVSYLTTCFERFSTQCRRVVSVGLEEVAGPRPTPPALQEKLAGAKLQIVIVCPQFLEQAANRGVSVALARLLRPDRVLAMLLGVSEEHFLQQHGADLMSYQQWRRVQVRDQDESFVGEFFEIATSMVARVWGQTAAHVEKAMFSLLPKKVKEGQNKVLVLLNDPISKEDKLKVSVDKNGERLAVAGVKRRNPYTLHFQMPPCCLEVSMLVSVYVEKNGEALGCRQVKCESKMRELDQILRSRDNPLEFMCQTLGFSPADREHLDSFLVGALQRNLPPHFNLLHSPGGQPHRPPSRTSSSEEYPTLLHFAAKFGLEKLAWQLLECPGGEQACDMRNACELTPAEMAEAAGHVRLANALRGYMQMTELTSMYSYLKIMSEGNHKTAARDSPRGNYQQPRPLNETYQVPPSVPRPVMDNYQVPPAARPFVPSSPVAPEDTPAEALAGYMEMHSSASIVSIPDPPPGEAANGSAHVPRSPSPKGATPQGKSNSRRQLDQMSVCSSRSDEERQLSAADSKKSQDQLSQGAQDELLEIINDFKDNVLTISEVEKLVDCWRNRNDVQQSFKDKQEQLSKMREEYERIQREMKESMKKPTPFDRIRKLFKGKSKEAKDSCAEISSPSPADVTKVGVADGVLPLCLRPVSSLSLQSSCSSSSSGRMSTASGCSGISLGDSGTHSDTDDRKQMLERGRTGKGGAISNYEIPPAPRPLFSPHRPLQQRLSPPRYITAPVRSAKPPSPAPETQPENQPQHFNIQDRPPQPVPRPDIPLEEGEAYISITGGDTEEGKPVLAKEGGNAARDECCSEYLDLQSDSGTCDGNTASTEGGDAPSTEVGAQSGPQSTPASHGTDPLPCPGGESENLREYMNVSAPSEKSTTGAPPVPPRPSSSRKQ